MANGDAPARLLCREFPFGSPIYSLSLALREGVLRKPLGLSWEPGDFAGEETAHHFGCFIAGNLVATLLLKPINQATLKMRQVAVAPDAQGKGVGSALVRYAEQFACRTGYRVITAHARETAVPFYRRLGYTVKEGPFLEITIPHFAIFKSL